MNTEEFRALGLATWGSRWQAALDRWLAERGHPVDRRTIRRWAAGDLPVPEWLVALLGVGAHQAPDPPEWLWAEGVGGPEPQSEYVVHTRFPRFIARVDYEDEADTISGITYSSAYGPVLCEIVWIDAPGDADVNALLRSAAEAVS